MKRLNHNERPKELRNPQVEIMLAKWINCFNTSKNIYGIIRESVILIDENSITCSVLSQFVVQCCHQFQLIAVGRDNTKSGSSYSKLIPI